MNNQTEICCEPGPTCQVLDFCLPSPYEPFMNCENTTLVSGVVSLANGQTLISVTGLQLTFVPTKVRVDFFKPAAGNTNIKGNVIFTSITADGFQVELDAAVPAVGYQMAYQVEP